MSIKTIVYCSSPILTTQHSQMAASIRIWDIDGNDGVGKTSVIKTLKDSFPNLQFNDRGILSRFTDIYEDDLTNFLPEDRKYIILDAEPKVCMERILARGPPFDKYDNFPTLFKYRNRFRRLAIRYGVYYIDNSKMNINETVNHVINILNGINLNQYIIPNPDKFNNDDFNLLPLLVEGYSKSIRIINEKHTLIKYKPTVYSHKQQREGIIPYTDQERMVMTRNILYLFDLEQIPHAYLYVGKDYVLCERLDIKKDIPPVEVIVKKCCLGTDKYRYHGIDKLVGRHGYPVAEPNRREYPELIVRFDYRNPNHIYLKQNPDGTRTDLGMPHFIPDEMKAKMRADPSIIEKPVGDEAMCDDLADQFINVHNAKKLAKKTFIALDNHFKNMGIYFEDVCFMITTDGTKHYYEISQDCGRYKLIDDSGLTDLDKDVWRAGGSSNLVYEKWRQMTQITKKYVKSIY